MKIRYIAVFALGMSLASCNLLDKEPSNEWDSSSAIKNLQDLEFAVNGVYESQTSSIDAGTNPRGSYAGDFGLYADMKGGDYMAIGKNNQASDVTQHTAGPTDPSPENFYKRFYLSIARVNKVMSQVAESGLEGEEVDAYIGELYALRALFHFDLARMFAKLPSTVGNLESEPGIVLATGVYEANYVGERASLAKTYETILGDLNLALDKMKPSMEKSGSSVAYKNSTQGHINYWAALALRARVQLYLDDKAVAGVSNYNELALADAKDIIDNSGYSLYKLEDYTSVWSKEFTDESLFEIKVTSLYNPQRNSVGYYTHAEGYAEAGISNEFKAFLEARPNDVRSQMIKEETDVDGKTNKGFYTQKYPGRDGQIYVNSPKVIRLSEVYLIAAEAAFKSGKGNAADYMNALRKVRIENYQPVASVTLEDILIERRLELNGEGHMAWDMWRNKKSVTSPNISTDNVINYDDYRAVLPIPQTEINVSHGKLQQNQGYN